MEEEKQSTLVEHLEELRARIIRSVLFLLVCAALLFNFSDQIISFLAKPVGELVFIAPQEAFITKIKVTFFSSLLVSLPFILYQAWRFISAGLQPGEKKYVLIFAPFSFIFFIAGVAFGYLVIIPLGLEFLLSFAAGFLSPMLTVSAYVSFVLALILIFGVIFQLPLAIVFLTKINLVSPNWLSEKRRQAVVFIFLISAFFTPPDIITQCLMSVPLLILYETGIIFSRLTYSRQKKQVKD